MDIKYFDTTTPESMKKAIRFESQNPDYKLINGRLDLTWMFEKKEIVSNCCSANIVLTDICSKCLEHCEKIEL
tara:strand:- start:1675 stop:1893 length:219 start_codon:yes stop_codon:yes gene_type:complete